MKNATIEMLTTDNVFRVDESKGATCCICGCRIPLVIAPSGCETTIGQDNPAPIVNDDESVCCESCNSAYVIPARMGQFYTDASLLLTLASRMRSNGCADVAVKGAVDLLDEAIMA